MSKKINEEIKRSLTNAYSDLTPDRLEKINESPLVSVRSMDEVWGERHKKEFHFAPVFAGIATVAAFAMAFLFPAGNTDTDRYAYVYIDVNPSIEIAADANGDVVYCKAYNADGEEIVSDEDVVESIRNKEKLSIIVENIIKTIRNKGYFSGQYDSVLLSCANTSVIGDENMKEMMDEVQSYVREKNVCKTVVYEEVSDYEEAKVKAEKYGISPGKAHYVEKIASEVIYTEEELATKNIDSIVALESKAAATEEATYEYVPETIMEQLTAEDSGGETVTVKEEIITEIKTETESSIMEETVTAPTETTSSIVVETTSCEEVTSAQPETTSFHTPQKMKIKIKKSEYEEGTLKVHFKKKVDWSVNGIVRVTSSAGSIVNAEFVEQNAEGCVIKMNDCTPGETYTVYFEGIKRKKTNNYTNFTFTFYADK